MVRPRRVKETTLAQYDPYRVPKRFRRPKADIADTSKKPKKKRWLEWDTVLFILLALAAILLTLFWLIQLWPD